jgi:glycosyltransferase involved in cell wall biosynthesis
LLESLTGRTEALEAAATHSTTLLESLTGRTEALEAAATHSTTLLESLTRRVETLEKSKTQYEEGPVGLKQHMVQHVGSLEAVLQDPSGRFEDAPKDLTEGVEEPLRNLVQRIEALETSETHGQERLAILQQQMAQRVATLTGELQALRHEQRLRRGTLGLLREMLNINDYIGIDGRSKAGFRLPLVARLYFRLRDTALARPVRRARGSLTQERAVGQVTVASPVDASPAPTVTMLVPDDRIDRRVLLSGRSLSEAGWSVTVIAAPYPAPIDQDQIDFPELHIVRIVTGVNAAVPPEALPGNPRHSASWRDVYFYHFNFLELALRHPALVYAANDLPVLPAAAVAAAEIGATLVFDAHELYPEIGAYSAEQRVLYREAEADLIKDAALVTTINQSIAEEMAQRYGIATPEILLNAPAALSAHDATPADVLRRELQISPDKHILLYQGLLALYRNLEDLVASMAAVQSEDVVLVIMGPDAGQREVLETIARDAGTLGLRVLFRDPVPQRVLLSYTAGADVGIVPYPAVDLNSRYCTPNKLFEFIVAGVPILANDLPELRRYVHDTGFGQVRTLDGPASFAAAIDTMFHSDLQSYRERLAARRHEFTWEAQGKKLVGLYRDLAPEVLAGRREEQPQWGPEESRCFAHRC